MPAEFRLHSGPTWTTLVCTWLVPTLRGGPVDIHVLRGHAFLSPGLGAGLARSRGDATGAPGGAQYRDDFLLFPECLLREGAAHGCSKGGGRMGEAVGSPTPLTSSPKTISTHTPDPSTRVDSQARPPVPPGTGEAGTPPHHSRTPQ